MLHFDFMSHFFFVFVVVAGLSGLLLVKKETTIFQKQFFIYIVHISLD